MTLEEQVVSLELAKQLKEVGYPQEESVFNYRVPAIMGTDEEDDAISDNPDYFDWTLDYGKTYGDNKEYIAAPTVAELGEQLPAYISRDKGAETLCYAKGGGSWGCWASTNGSDQTIKDISAKSEADARAQMWIYLKNNGLLNEREGK